MDPAQLEGVDASLVQHMLALANAPPEKLQAAIRACMQLTNQDGGAAGGAAAAVGSVFQAGAGTAAEAERESAAAAVPDAASARCKTEEPPTPRKVPKSKGRRLPGQRDALPVQEARHQGSRHQKRSLPSSSVAAQATQQRQDVSRDGHLASPFSDDSMFADEDEHAQPDDALAPDIIQDDGYGLLNDSEPTNDLEHALLLQAALGAQQQPSQQKQQLQPDQQLRQQPAPPQQQTEQLQQRQQPQHPQQQAAAAAAKEAQKPRRKLPSLKAKQAQPQPQAAAAAEVLSRGRHAEWAVGQSSAASSTSPAAPSVKAELLEDDLPRLRSAAPAREKTGRRRTSRSRSPKADKRAATTTSQPQPPAAGVSDAVRHHQFDSAEASRRQAASGSKNEKEEAAADEDEQDDPFADDDDDEGPLADEVRPAPREDDPQSEPFDTPMAPEEPPSADEGPPPPSIDKAFPPAPPPPCGSDADAALTPPILRPNNVKQPKARPRAPVALHTKKSADQRVQDSAQALMPRQVLDHNDGQQMGASLLPDSNARAAVEKHDTPEQEEFGASANTDVASAVAVQRQSSQAQDAGLSGQAGSAEPVALQEASPAGEQHRRPLPPVAKAAARRGGAAAGRQQATEAAGDKAALADELRRRPEREQLASAASDAAASSATARTTSRSRSRSPAASSSSRPLSAAVPEPAAPKQPLPRPKAGPTRAVHLRPSAKEGVDKQVEMPVSADPGKRQKTAADQPAAVQPIAAASAQAKPQNDAPSDAQAGTPAARRPRPWEEPESAAESASEAASRPVEPDGQKAGPTKAARPYLRASKEGFGKPAAQAASAPPAKRQKGEDKQHAVPKPAGQKPALPPGLPPPKAMPPKTAEPPAQAEPPTKAAAKEGGAQGQAAEQTAEAAAKALAKEAEPCASAASAIGQKEADEMPAAVGADAGPPKQAVEKKADQASEATSVAKERGGTEHLLKAKEEPEDDAEPRPRMAERLAKFTKMPIQELHFRLSDYGMPPAQMNRRQKEELAKLLLEAEDFEEAAQTGRPAPGLKYSLPCHFFFNGRGGCKKGSGCWFSHGEEVQERQERQERAERYASVSLLETIDISDDESAEEEASSVNLPRDLKAAEQQLAAALQRTEAMQATPAAATEAAARDDASSGEATDYGAAEPAQAKTAATPSEALVVDPSTPASKDAAAAPAGDPATQSSQPQRAAEQPPQEKSGEAAAEKPQKSAPASSSSAPASEKKAETAAASSAPKEKEDAAQATEDAGKGSGVAEKAIERVKKARLLKAKKELALLADKMKAEGASQETKGAGSSSSQPGVKATKGYCREFQRGACWRGAECRFSHETDKDFTEEVCKEFLSGRCARWTCKFVHTWSEATRDAGAAACLDFKNNKCWRYDCKFSHSRGEPFPDAREQSFLEAEEWLRAETQSCPGSQAESLVNFFCSEFQLNKDARQRLLTLHEDVLATVVRSYRPPKGATEHHGKVISFANSVERKSGKYLDTRSRADEAAAAASSSSSSAQPPPSSLLPPHIRDHPVPPAPSRRGGEPPAGVAKEWQLVDGNKYKPPVDEDSELLADWTRVKSTKASAETFLKNRQAAREEVEKKLTATKSHVAELEKHMVQAEDEELKQVAVFAKLKGETDHIFSPWYTAEEQAEARQKQTVLATSAAVAAQRTMRLKTEVQKLKDEVMGYEDSLRLVENTVDKAQKELAEVKGAEEQLEEEAKKRNLDLNVATEWQSGAWAQQWQRLEQPQSQSEQPHTANRWTPSASAGSAGEAAPAPAAAGKRSYCHDFVNGNCNRGNYCKFSHISRQDLPAAASEALAAALRAKQVRPAWQPPQPPPPQHLHPSQPQAPVPRPQPVLPARMQTPPGGGLASVNKPHAATINEFIVRHGLDDAAAKALQGAPSGIQKMVIANNDRPTPGNVSATVLAYIKTLMGVPG
eukprot:TRINITY_DN34834_c0_g1_i1.p1 TRINITY_DN34834_c0_g1~~TRINITY_DN34834_c0_g1_i1.p1  ORF type:complete len:1937 (+),score=560.10 TRINITY_DN34834_c0_g1_i1:125-5935(+)